MGSPLNCIQPFSGAFLAFHRMLGCHSDGAFVLGSHLLDVFQVIESNEEKQLEFYIC